LPRDFESFLEQSNGGILFGIEIYGSQDAYWLDEEDESKKYLVISHNAAGRPICLDVRGSGVVLIEEHTDPLRIASSFDNWLHTIEEDWNGA
jgi:hypothetical protein